jgi:lipoprotein-anchoring transpeptidase ErfK/SrfK
VVRGRARLIALLTAAGAVGLTTQADAAIYYWQDSGPGFWRPPSPALQRRQRVRHQTDQKTEVAEKETTKPQGPLIISISIAQQKLRIYDANGLFAEAPVSTGMPGHPTPMGVFSVIQKHKFHHSNIYSGAPMPYMQRITWSGVAIHAGVLPGYPASHGCIRMPMAFAVKMWNWTKMGARVVITPGDVTPASFSHPLLATLKAQPEQVATEMPKEDVAALANLASKRSEAETNAKAVVVEASVELRTTVARDDGAEPAGNQKSASAVPQRRTADGDASPVTNPSARENPKEKSAEDVKVVPSAPAIAAGPKVEQSQPADAMKAALSKIDPSKRGGPIAVFVSRKDSKLYVRQNFAPLFDMPITILPDERPLGTHVFTAQVDKDDTNVLHWSVVSLPAPTRYADRRGEDERSLRRRKNAAPVEAKPSPEQDSPTQALDHLKLPAEAMARITEALSTGGSIIVSDQGIAAGETGEGTDFIVRLR